MQIGIIGSGHIGGTFARLLVAAGHEVAIANSRGPESLKSFVAELGPKARAVSVDEAARFGELVVVSIPLGRQLELDPAPFRGRIVIDTGNYYPARDGQIRALDQHETSSSALFARHLEGARVVKSLNTIYFEHLRTQGDRNKPLDQRRAIFVAADDAAAKALFAGLLEELGFGPVDAGSLADSARLEPGSPVYNKVLTRAQARAALTG
ncbi:MAG: NADPH-dependent F420 reductase [Polyangiales bacterium]